MSCGINALSVRDLSIMYGNAANPVVDGLCFDIVRSETLGLFGKSGCGKSSVALAVMRMLDAVGGTATGEIIYEERELLSLPENEMHKIRWREIAMVPQSSMNALNPVYTIKKTMFETIRAHEGRKTPTKELQERCEELLDLAQLDRRVLSSYPHELSGGMRQRISIALALALAPELLILDEATTGLDVTVEADILHTIRQIKEKRHLSLIFITHDLRLQNSFCDRRIEL
ncbi:MAG: ABC transporter ATP-binding protein [Clostridiales bacterium]|nr:ABC transporter ATP-binding protein [Clostridiales bacterium]